MSHRSVASIVLVFGLTLTLTACVNAQMSADSSSAGTNAGSIAPIPGLPNSAFSETHTPQNSEGTPISGEKLNVPLQRLLEASSQQSGNVWVKVVDFPTGEVLLDYNTDKPHTPASTTKILSALTALTYLDENATLSTGTTVLDDSVYLWGEGDLLLGVEEPNAYDVNGRASLSVLARDTARALEERGKTNIVLHWAPQPFDGPAHLPQWSSQEVHDFEGRVAAYAIDSGSMRSQMSFVADPELHVATEFQDALENEGISVTLGEQVGPPDGGEQIASVQSATLGEQIRYMLIRSDNTLADQLCRLSARQAQRPTTYQGAATLVSETIAQMGIDTEGMELEDCSGLSLNNQIPASVLTDALRVALNSEKSDIRDLVRDLPWAGAQGTMARRFYDGTALGNVQAKTGSLGTVSSLAGFVRTAGGRELVFAVGIDETEEGVAYTLRPAIDAFVQEMTTL